MRVVNTEASLKSSISLTQQEAAAAFQDDRIYIEKYLENPRHVEFQVLMDNFGNGVHLGERTVLAKKAPKSTRRISSFWARAKCSRGIGGIMHRGL